MRYLILGFLVSIFPAVASAQDNDLASALAVCQKDPAPEARIACYNAVKEVQVLRENPLLKAMNKQANKKAASKDVNSAMRDEKKPSVDEVFANSAVEVRLLGKKFYASDYKAGRVQDFLNLQLEFTMVGIEKPTRAIKGVVVFADLFGETKMRINWLLDDPLIPEQTLKYLESGFRPNQFSDSHNWLKNNDIDDINVSYEVESIIYADGSKWVRK